MYEHGIQQLTGVLVNLQNSEYDRMEGIGLVTSAPGAIILTYYVPNYFGKPVQNHISIVISNHSIDVILP